MTDITPPPDAGLLPADARAICRLDGTQVVDWRGQVYVWRDDGFYHVAYDPLVAALAEEVRRLRAGLVAAGRGEALEGNGHE